MNEELQIFNSTEFGVVRVVEKNGEPWFVGKDIAEILGYAVARNAIAKHVDEEDKKGAPIQGDLGGKQEMTIINESGLYSLILRSKLETAKKFKKWVTSEVLPSIRKHGAYMTENTIEKAITDPDFLIRLATELKEEQIKRKELEEINRDLIIKNTVQDQVIQQQAPKALFADAVSASQTSILVGELAKILKQNGVNTGQKRFFEWLRDNGYLIKRKGTDYNMPTQRSMEQCLFEIKETPIVHGEGHITVNKTTKVTGKGQIYFINKLKPALVEA